ncbi:MAG: L-ribulose-5-phosphate 3-epimerase [Ruminococcus sp.]|nr:L-ribulose-5-phosphate 3-epimerase [Ruminococcus sp.]
MKSYELGLYEKAMPSSLSWWEKLTAAKKAGYDYLEMSIDASEEKIRRIYMSKQERFELIRDMYQTEMPIRTMCVSALTKFSLGNPDGEKAGRGMEIAEKSIELAADLGIRVVMIPGYDVYYEPSDEKTKRGYLENLRRVAEIAEKTGVILGLETMENEFMNTVEKAMKYVVLCGSNYLKIYPDIGNLTNAAKQYKMDVLEDLQLGKGNITSMHLKETLPGRYREVPYGTGHVDFEAAIQKAWQMGIRRYVTEFWYLGEENWSEELKKAHDKMSKILNEQE